ncbi:hypothetical protein ACROYT_G044685 [Oculina patagonica]
MVTEKFALDNNAVVMLKLRHQTLFASYSTGNRSTCSRVPSFALDLIPLSIHIYQQESLHLNNGSIHRCRHFTVDLSSHQCRDQP